MRISGCLARAGAEHHAHQRVSGELQIQSNPSPTKLNFVGLAKNKSTGGEERGGGRVSCKYLGYALNGLCVVFACGS